MRTLIAAAIILGAVPAFAQNSFTTTQSPPAGNSSQSTPNTTNGLPQAAGTERPTQQPGSAVGSTRVTPPPAAARRPVKRARARARPHNQPAR